MAADRQAHVHAGAAAEALPAATGLAAPTPGRVGGRVGTLLMCLRQFRAELARELFDEDGLAAVFTHARNVLTGTIIVAAGVYAAHHLERSARYGMWTVHVAGYVVAALGAVLLLLNLVDGLRRLSRRRHPLPLRLATIVVYVALSARLTQVAIYFRSPF